MSIRSRSIVGTVVVIALVIAGVLAGGASAESAPCWFPPVTGIVTDPYREPACRWCAGNRGLDYRVGDDAVVRAAASGRVEFVGVVVDVRYVVIRLPNGWRHTYGRLASSRPQQGDIVFAGAPIGRAEGTFFFGLRIGDDYADPAPFIGELRGRPRLVPLDGPARPAPPARPRCRTSDERTALPGAVRSLVHHGGVGGYEAVDALPGSRRVIAWFACGSTATMSSVRSGGPGRVDWQ